MGFSFIAGSKAQVSIGSIKELPDSPEKVDTLLTLARSYWYSDPSESIKISKYALRIGEQNNYPLKEADALNVIGGGYYFLENIDSAIYYFNQSLEKSQNHSYTEGIARVSNNLGLIHDFLGNYDMAIDFYYQSLDIEQVAKNSKGIASSYLNIANIYYYLEDYNKALEFMTNSLNLYQEMKDEKGILSCFTNIGSVYSEIGIYENALSYSNNALQLSRKMNDPDMEAANLNNIGKVYFNIKNFGQSINYYTRALELSYEHDDLWSQANTLRNIGGVYMVQGNGKKALEYLKKSIAIAKNLKAKNLLQDIYYDFSEIYDQQGDFKNALYYHRQHSLLKDSLFGEKSRTEIAKIESSYKLQYKDQQLDLIRKENEVKNLTIKTQRATIFIIGIGAFLILAVVFIFYKRAIVHKKAELWLEKTNGIIVEHKSLLEQSVEELKESEEQYKALTSSIQDGLIIVKDRKLIFANTIFIHMLGYQDFTEILALKPEQALSENDLGRVLKNHDDRLSGKDVPTEYTISLIHKSGKLIEASIRVTIIQYQGKQAIIGTIKDLSGVKTYEDQLILAKENAEKATQSKSMFLASMSHEIRNHLNGIIGISDLLSDSDLNEEQKNFVQIIKTSGDTLLNIINEILDLTKIEAGQVQLDKKRFNIRSVVQDVISLYELKAQQQNLVLNCVWADDIPDYIVGDPVRLSQILTNLVGNALKFTDDGSVVVQVNEIERNKDEIGFKFSVIDTGIGISEESQEKLFKPFSQTHAALERNLAGTGLGLVICKQLVKLMGGDIGVKSKPGEGSEFWFTTKLQLNTSESVKKVNGKSQKTNGHHAILLVEDNLLNQHLTTTILKKEGMQADVASNGKEGVDLFRQCFYDVILMDIQMPVMDGLEATQLIRKYENDNYKDKSTIIAITAHIKEGDEQKLKDAGIDFYLQKPFKPDELMGIIRNRPN